MSYHQASFSPSVTLEKGAYRMRKPSIRQATRPSARRPAHRPCPTYMLVLLLLLTSGTLSCFGAAYYLFTTRWGSRIVNPVENTQTDANTVQVVAFNLDSELEMFRNHRHDKFLAYLPHSGFHNQRIAFENALVLSRLLNRTLLAPPVRLGEKTLRYVKFDTLREFILLSGKEGLLHCAKVPKYTSFPPECFDYFEYTHIPWEWLVNLSTIRSHQRVLQSWDMSDTWLRKHLQIAENDTLTLVDSDPYNFRFLDSLNYKSSSGDKFLESIYIPDLAVCSKRLLQIGTLFGSSRLRLRDPDRIRIRGDIRRSMAFSNPYLVRAANSIAHSLGGAYLGAHIRLGDGLFIVNGPANARLVWWKLVHIILGFSVDESSELESLVQGAGCVLDPPHIPVDVPALRAPRLSQPPLPEVHSPSLACRGQVHQSPKLKRLNTPLFVSTDAKNALTHPSMALFLQTFPCTFFLSDFASEMAPLGRLQSGYDGLMLKDFLVPFLDAMVVGKAWAVAGTELSTFSRFVEDVLWRTYHGWDIVQRG